MTLPSPDELPPKLKFSLDDIRSADPNVVTVMVTLHFENGNAGYKLIGFVEDKNGNPTDGLIFERVFGELA